MRFVVPCLLAAMAVIATACARSGSDASPAPATMELRELDLASRDGAPIQAVCYGPHRDGQRPGGASPTREQIREDLAIIRRHWDLLRVYGAAGVTETILQEARAGGPGLRVVLGAWIAPDDTLGNRSETDAAIRLARAYPDVVVAVSVGNETQVSWSAHRCPPETLLRNVRRVREQVTVPVAVADDYNFWNKPESRDVAAEVDFVIMHAHPLWNGVLLADALPWVREQVAAVRALHPDRPVILGETGWATSVHDEGEQARLIKGRAGEAEQREFCAALRGWSAGEELPVFLFEAFDENWKGGEHPAEVEKHWGVYRADRTPKAAVGVLD